jgi:hypothetical protein
MSDHGMACGICGAPVASWGAICGPCAGAKQLQKKLASAKPTGGAVPTGPMWAYFGEAAAGITKGGYAKYRNAFDDLLPAVTACIGNCQSDKKATTFGEQSTIWTDTKNDNLTVDYQGTRAGSGGSLWVDIQGQDGKASSRKTYFQILVEVNPASAPLDDMVRAAIVASSKDKQRYVIHCSDARPK